MKKGKLRNNRDLIREAEKVLVGGVDSPVRAFRSVGDDPIPIKRGLGSQIYDYDGKSYVDYVLSYGAAVLGHAHPYVVNRLNRASLEGFSFGATCAEEVELADLIKKSIPLIEKIRFVNSGTEAVMGAVRLARGHTGRDKILKFTNAYHGHADYFLARGGSGLATLNIPTSRGVPKDFFTHTIITDYGDPKAIGSIFKRYRSKIAAVIVEPVGGNYGVIPPDINFLKKLRQITRQHGSLLIFDEVITGFRLHYGSAAAIFGVRPDIICLGKIIGGGLPIGAFAGSGEIMNQLAPEGSVYQASTFGGNPLVMTAGTATLTKLHSLKKDYNLLTDRVSDICETMEYEAGRKGVALKVNRFKTMFSIRFAKRRQFGSFYRRLLSLGVYLAPSEYESNFISFVHTRDDVEKTKRALGRALGS